VEGDEITFDHYRQHTDARYVHGLMRDLNVSVTPAHIDYCYPPDLPKGKPVHAYWRMIDRLDESNTGWLVIGDEQHVIDWLTGFLACQLRYNAHGLMIQNEATR